MTNQTVQPAKTEKPQITLHHAKCLVEFAEAAFGELSDVELLRHLRDMHKKWDAHSLRVGDARVLALLLMERARRIAVRSEGGAS